MKKTINLSKFSPIYLAVICDKLQDFARNELNILDEWCEVKDSNNYILHLTALKELQEQCYKLRKNVLKKECK